MQINDNGYFSPLNRHFNDSKSENEYDLAFVYLERTGLEEHIQTGEPATRYI
jgi:hypothetical protein